MGSLQCCTTSLASTWSLGRCNLSGVIDSTSTGVIGFNWKWRIRFAIVRVFDRVLFADDFSALVSGSVFLTEWSKYVYFRVCMFNLSHLSKFLRGTRRKRFRNMLSKFRSKSGVITSIASRFQTTVVAAFKLRAFSIENMFQPSSQQEVAHRFMFTTKTYCLFWTVWLWDTFQPKQFETQSLLWQRWD